MTIIYFILIMSIIVCVHELGHMLVAKFFGVYVAEFAIGFGPKLLKKQGKETLYSIRAIPLGGFNKMVESEKDNSDPEKAIPVERTLYGIHPLKRIAILLAGPVFNIILAFIVYMALFCGSSEIYQYPDTTIHAVEIDSPAYIAGIQENDKIIKIEFEDGDSVETKDWYDISVYCDIHNNSESRIITLDRNGQKVTVTLTPKLDEESGSYLMGITGGQGKYVELNVLQRLGFGISYTCSFIKLYAKTIVNLLKGIGLENVGGTVAIYKTTEMAASYGLESLVSLTATLSISIGLMNLIPIPIFDGGRIVLSLIELIIGRRLNAKVESIILNTSAILIIILFVLITIKDVISLF